MATHCDDPATGRDTFATDSRHPMTAARHPATAARQKRQKRQTAVVGWGGTECFGHGQLYVAASRVGDPAWLRFALDPNDAGEYRTKNVVYAEALTSLMCGECECE